MTGCRDHRSLTGNTDIRMGDLRITIGQLSHEGLVEEYLWDGTDGGLTIDIPDVTDRNEKITELGGFANIGVPDFFRISLKPLDDGFEPWTGPYGKPIPEGTKEYEDAENARKEYMKQNPLYGRIVAYKGGDESLYDAPISYGEKIFTINLGRYISKIQIDSGIDGREYIGFRQDDDSIVFYEPRIRFNCDDQNETFYAKDGILYSAETNEKQIFQIDYADDIETETEATEQVEEDLPVENDTKDAEVFKENVKEPVKVEVKIRI